MRRQGGGTKLPTFFYLRATTKSKNQTTTGEKMDTISPYDMDKDFIRQVFQCRKCDFESEALSVVSAHIEVHKRAGPSKSRPPPGYVHPTKQFVTKSPNVSGGQNLPKSETREGWLRELNSSHNYPFRFLTASVPLSDSKVRCEKCEDEFVVKQKSHLTTHLKTKKHQDHIKFKADRKEFYEQGKYDLAKDLCRLALAANIAWNKFDNPVVEEILGKHMQKKVPSATTIARRLPECYSEVMTEIKKDLDGSPFWLGTDETNGMDNNSHAYLTYSSSRQRSSTQLA